MNPFRHGKLTLWQQCQRDIFSDVSFCLKYFFREKKKKVLAIFLRPEDYDFLLKVTRFNKISIDGNLVEIFADKNTTPKTFLVKLEDEQF